MKISLDFKENISISFRYVFEFIFALSLVLNCRSIWLYLTVTGSFFKHFVLALLFLSVGGIILISGRISVLSIQKLIFTLMGLIIYSGVLLILTDSNTLDYVQLFVAVVFIIVYYFFNAERNIISTLKKYEYIVLIIAAVSLFFWVGGSILHIIPSTGNVYSIWSGMPVSVKNYFWVYYESQVDQTFGNEMVRNTAIFSEAPMASMNFSIAFLVEYFLTPKPSKKRLAILVVAIISTVSFTGYILVILSIAAKYIISSPKSSIGKFFKVFGVIIAVSIISVVGNWLLSKKMDTSSGSVRLEDFVVGFKAWLTSPIIGHGFGNMKSAESFMRAWRRATKQTGVSNSITVLLTQGGLCIFIIYFYPVFKTISQALKKKNTDYLLFTCMIVYMFVITSCAYAYIIIFLFICFADKNFTSEKQRRIIEWLKKNH